MNENLEKITPEELIELIKSRKEDLIELTNLTKDLYQCQGYLIDSPLEIPEEDIDDSIFSDSYVGGEEFDFIAYCICSYLKIDPRIDIIEAYKNIEKLVEIGNTQYQEHLKEYGSLQDYYDNYPNSPYEFNRKWGEEMYGKPLKHYKSINIDPKEVVVDGDDPGDEFVNPLEFAADSAQFANLCKANELANQLEDLSNRAKWLVDRIHLM